MHEFSECSPTEPGPVFVGGPHRSGTGMLRAVLGSNSRLAMPPKEYQFFERMSQVRGASPAARLEAILQWPKVREWALPDLRPKELLAGTDCSERAVFTAPLLAYARKLNKPRFGEKTPFLERDFDTLLRWFGPGLRFVQIVRHPLATFASLNRQNGQRSVNDPVRFARNWLASSIRGLDLTRRYPENHLLLRYEDFTAEPELWTRRLCDFCDLPTEIDAMLSMRDFTRKSNSSFADLEGSGHAEIRTEPALRPAPVSKLDAWLIARELGPFKSGIALWQEDGAGLPVERVADEKRRDTPILAKLSVLCARLSGKLSLPGGR